MKSIPWWPTSYEDGRRRFRALCAEAGATPFTYALPDRLVSDLTVDVARFGSWDADRVLLVVSGIHGLEGPSGTVAQTSWAEARLSIPSNCAVVLVHAANPWGYRYRSRLTANGVDLNRNFIDFGDSSLVNRMADRLRGRLLMSASGKRHLFNVLNFIDELRDEIGEVDLQMAINGGQYRYPGEASFGGHELEPNNIVLREIVERHCGTAAKVALIDWHTGVGNYGEVAFLMMRHANGELHQPAVDWWGREIVEGWSGNGFSLNTGTGISQWNAIPGQFRNALADMLPHAEVTGATIEFGTFCPGDTWQDTIYDIFCHHQEDWVSYETEYMRAEMVRMYNPEDADWRHSVNSIAPIITNQAISGLTVD